MVALAELLELLYGAHTRCESVRATLSVEIDHSLLERNDWPEDALNPPPPPSWPQAYVARIWAEPTGRIRLERDVDGEHDVQVFSGDGEDDGLDERASLAAGYSDLFDPAPLLGAARFEVLDESTQAGRKTATILARPRRGPIEIASLWGCDAYELAVDLERGVLLRVDGQIHGVSAGTIAVEEIVFDESLPSELFEHDTDERDPPDFEEEGTLRIEPVSLRAAAERVPFTLWVVRQLLDEWRLYVRLVEAEPHASEPAWVEILYRSRGGANRVELIEERADEQLGHGWTSYGQPSPRTIDHRGEHVLVLAQEPYETQLVLTRGATRIRMSAFDALAETLELVDALGPV